MNGEQSRSKIFSEVASALCEQTIECGGQKFQPDDGTGYLDCRLSHAMVITHYGEALHPGTIANSFNSMLHKNVNLQHQLRAHDRAKIMKDRIVGCVAAVELLGEQQESGVRGQESADQSRNGLQVLGNGTAEMEILPLVWTGSDELLPDKISLNKGAAHLTPGTWHLTPDGATAIRAVLALFKQADGMERVIGAHQSGRKKYTVSMEVLYRNTESGFLVANGTGRGLLNAERGTRNAESQNGNALAGFDYIPFEKADAELLGTRDWDHGRMKEYRASGGYVGNYRGRETFWLMGGVNGRVHYGGIGIVEAGAEPTATITQMLASREEEEAVAEELRRAAAWLR